MAGMKKPNDHAEPTKVERYNDIIMFFDNQTVVNKVVCLSMFKQKIIECFLQNWYTSKSMLTLCLHVKDRFEYENYLDIMPFDLRYFLLRLRVSSHSLRKQTGRYGNDRLPRNERICVYCDLNDIDDEYFIIMSLFK